jgi:hypothetical protein
MAIQLAWYGGWLWGIYDLKALGSLNSDLGKCNPPEFRSPKLGNSSFFFDQWGSRSVSSSSQEDTRRGKAGAHSLRGRGKPASRITYPNAFPFRFPSGSQCSSAAEMPGSQCSRTLETHGSHCVPDALQHLRFSVPIVFPLLHQPNITLGSHHVPNSHLRQHLIPITFPMLFNNRHT